MISKDQGSRFPATLLYRFRAGAVLRHVSLLFCTLFLTAPFLHAQSFDKVGTTTAKFLSIGVGPRAMGLGGSFVALSNDGTAPFWNPAGMTSLKGITTTLSHLNWVLDITHEYISVIIPTGDIGVFGISLTALTMDEKEVTTVREPEGNGQMYSVLDLALGVHFAKRISDRLSYGLTGKYIRLAGYNEVAQAFAVDIGSILRTDFYGMTIGMALSNFGSEAQYKGRDLINKADIDDEITGNYPVDVDLRTEPWPLPLMIRIGVGMDILGSGQALISNPVNRLTMTVDAEHPNDSPEHVNFGVEYSFNEMVFLRSGYRFNYDDDTFTFGAGLRSQIGPLGDVVINYAVFPLGPFGKISQFSVELILQ